MGVRASLCEITPDLFRRLVRGEEPKIPDRNCRLIDKAWFDLHSVFRKKGHPLSLVIAGDRLHPQSPRTLEDFCNGGHDWYLGLASPELVREAAEALSGISSVQLRKWYDEQDCGGYDLEFYLFAELKSAYASAAEHGNALMILVA
jgi:hypothetical protein